MADDQISILDELKGLAKIGRPTVTASVSPETKAALEKLADEAGISVSDVLRYAISRVLTDVRNDGPS
jgi:hypothetical protein